MPVVDQNFLYPNPNVDLASAVAFVCLWSCDTSQNQIARSNDNAEAEDRVTRADMLVLKSAAQHELRAVLVSGFGMESAKVAREVADAVSVMLTEQVYQPESLTQLHRFVGYAAAAVWNLRDKRPDKDVVRWKNSFVRNSNHVSCGTCQQHALACTC